jgi:hypothetical protein
MPKYALRTFANTFLTSHGGFQWRPLGEVTTAPDWVNNDCCGNGLHGCLDGQGDAGLLNWSPDAPWGVVEIDDDTMIVDLNGKVKFPKGTLVFGNLEKCKSWINLLMPAQMPSVVSEYERWLKTVDLS